MSEDLLLEKNQTKGTKNSSIQSPKRRFLLKSSGLTLGTYVILSKYANAQEIFQKKNSTQNQLTDTTDDILNIIRVCILTGLSYFPEGGDFISSIVGLFWPPFGLSPWDQIKDEVNELIDIKIDEAIFQLVKNDLIGLGNNLKEYLGSLQTKEPTVISENFVACHQIFINLLPQFQSSERQETLLPLFALFGILHLSLLREGVLNASSMDWNRATKEMYIQEAAKAIEGYGSYIDKIYGQIQARADAKAEEAEKSDIHYVLGYYYRNECYRSYQLSVLDFREIYPYYDPVKYPKEVTVNLNRVLYHGPIGTNDDVRREVFIDKDRYKSLCPPDSISLYSGGDSMGEGPDGYSGAIVGFCLRYPKGFGPDGQQENFFGRHLPDDGVIDIDCSKASGGPITEAWTYFRTPYDYWIYHCSDWIFFSLYLLHKNGKREDTAGGCGEYSLPNYKFSIPNHLLVDIVGQSNSVTFGCIGCVLLGFQLENMGHSNDPKFLLPFLYKRSMQKLSINEFIDSIFLLPTINLRKAIDSQQDEFNLNDYVSQNIDKWEQERKEFWEHCEGLYFNNKKV